MSIRPLRALCGPAAIAVLLLATAGSAPAQPEAQLARIRALQQQRPGDGLLVHYEAMTQAQAGDRAAAVATLRRLLGRGLGLVPLADMGFDTLQAEPGFSEVHDRLLAETPRTPDAPVVLRLPADAARLIPEGIAYDAKRRTHYLGSIAERRVLAVDAQGRTRPLSTAADALDAVLGLAVDAARDRLCAVSTNGFEDSAQQQRRNAVVCWSLPHGRRVLRVAVPEVRQLNDLAFAPDGSLLVTDSMAGSLWRVTSDGSPRRVGADGVLRGANGVAVAPDGGAAYVTASTGILRVGLPGGDATRLPQPDDVVSGGLDGLYWAEGDLVGVQNTVNPGRVLRFTLADGGTRIAAATVLQSHHHPDFAEPTTGVVVDGALHVMANSYVAYWLPAGRIDDSRAPPPRAPVVVAVPLRGAPRAGTD
jgi:sugar lactone lactonase YvrE